MKRLIIVLASVAFLASCNDFAGKSAKTIAAASAFINAENAQHAISCNANPSQQVCQLLVRSSAAVNTAIDALETYCGGPQFAGGGNCQPHAAYADKVNAAIMGLSQDVSDIKQLTGGK